MVGQQEKARCFQRSQDLCNNLSILLLPELASVYGASIRVSVSKLVVAKVLEVPSVVLVESFEAIVEVDWC